MSNRVLTPEQINEAKQLRDKEGLSKRALVRYFNNQGIEIGATTIWENVLRKYPNKKIRVRIYHKKVKPEPIIPCTKCGIALTKEFYDLQIPVNYQIGTMDICISCYMESKGLQFMDLLKIDWYNY